jgi:hypothetical protein
MEHRSACHKCGNMRKNLFYCKRCPYTFCVSCVSKLIPEYGESSFSIHGCPVCLDLCCCGTNRSSECQREHHCYKKVINRKQSYSCHKLINFNNIISA